MSRTLYDILGVPRSASPEALRSAYRRAILASHPDKLPPSATPRDVEAAAARFHDVRTAYDVLADPAKRRAYDNGLDFLRRTAAFPPPPAFRAPPPDPAARARLQRERAAWAAQAERRHAERMREVADARRRRENEWAAARRASKGADAAGEEAGGGEGESGSREEEAEGEEAAGGETVARRLEDERAYRDALELELELAAAAREEREAELRMKRSAAAAAGGGGLGFPEMALLADEMLTELKRLNPEWEARREAVMRRRAERMQSERARAKV
ncbi:DnaJ-domain-containing protein [Obba rivulosa]|uniref:DnaJ-domain-containing protein n=1 Tax=Obba rivulosa TaxID=1052685 RepID=A0A8E2DPZ7_9APHY|nr:DnaJ-domain-containing protein [Obba rivulosa]